MNRDENKVLIAYFTLIESCIKRYPTKSRVFRSKKAKIDVLSIFYRNFRIFSFKSQKFIVWSFLLIDNDRGQHIEVKN